MIHCWKGSDSQNSTHSELCLPPSTRGSLQKILSGERGETQTTRDMRCRGGLQVRRLGDGGGKSYEWEKAGRHWPRLTGLPPRRAPCRRPHLSPLNPAPPSASAESICTSPRWKGRYVTEQDVTRGFKVTADSSSFMVVKQCKMWNSVTI